MIRADYARSIPVTLHFKGIQLGNRSLCVCVVFFTCHMCNKMSDVRLSNASPTLERVDARQPDNVRPAVRRNLFGRPDREEIRRYVTASIQEEVEGFRERYNFDPESETPLATRNYDWQEARDAPEFYRRQPHGSQPPRGEEDPPGESNLRDAEERRERRAAQPSRDDSRKRRSDPCSSDCETKRSHITDEDDDEDQKKGAGSEAEERPSSGGSPERGAEVQ